MRSQSFLFFLTKAQTACLSMSSQPTSMLWTIYSQHACPYLVRPSQYYVHDTNSMPSVSSQSLLYTLAKVVAACLSMPSQSSLYTLSMVLCGSMPVHALSVLPLYSAQGTMWQHACPCLFALANVQASSLAHPPSLLWPIN